MLILLKLRTLHLNLRRLKMSGLLPKPKTIKAPPVEEPEPAPTELIETTEDVKKQEARKRRARRGRKETVITGQFSPEIVGKKRLLG
jgi:hypothetical protein